MPDLRPPHPNATVSSAAIQTFDARQGRALRDPLGISGLILAAKTEAMGRQVAVSMNHAAYHSERARQAELGGNGTEAIRQRDTVFNGFFPK